MGNILANLQHVLCYHTERSTAGFRAPLLGFAAVGEKNYQRTRNVP